MIIKKHLVPIRKSKGGGGVNMIIGGAFVYFDQSEYDRIMANDDIEAIEVTDDVEELPLRDGQQTATKTRAVVQYIERRKSAEEKADEAISLSEKTEKIKPESLELLRALGIFQ